MAIGDASSVGKLSRPLEEKTLAKSRRDFKVKLRKLRKNSKEHIRNSKDVGPDATGFIPISLARRAVLRSACLVDVEQLLAIQKLFKAEQSLLNGMLAAFCDGTDNDELKFVRLAWQTSAEERLKRTTQVHLIFPNDQGVFNGANQNLLELFYKEYGLPNDAEKALLSQCTDPVVSSEDLDRFFAYKESRLVAVRLLETQMRIAMLGQLDIDTFTKTWKPKKPDWRP